MPTSQRKHSYLCGASKDLGRPGDNAGGLVSPPSPNSTKQIDPFASVRTCERVPRYQPGDQCVKSSRGWITKPPGGKSITPLLVYFRQHISKLYDALIDSCKYDASKVETTYLWLALLYVCGDSDDQNGQTHKSLEVLRKPKYKGRSNSIAVIDAVRKRRCCQEKWRRFR